MLPVCVQSSTIFFILQGFSSTFHKIQTLFKALKEEFRFQALSSTFSAFQGSARTLVNKAHRPNFACFLELELVEIQLKLKMYLHLNLLYAVMLDGDYKKEKILFAKLQQKVLTQAPLAEMLGIIAM